MSSIGDIYQRLNPSSSPRDLGIFFWTRTSRSRISYTSSKGPSVKPFSLRFTFIGEGPYLVLFYTDNPLSSHPNDTSYTQSPIDLTTSNSYVVSIRSIFLKCIVSYLKRKNKSCITSTTLQRYSPQYNSRNEITITFPPKLPTLLLKSFLSYRP